MYVSYLCTPQEISKDNVSHQPSVRYFQQSLLFHPLPLPATPASRKIRHGKTDTSRSKVRILFPGTLLPRVFSSQSPPPGPSSIFFFSFFFISFLFPAVSLIFRFAPLPALFAKRRGITRQNCKMQTCKPQS